MKQCQVFLLVCLVSTFSLAEPLVTISCDTPKGSRMEYGESSFDRVQSAIDKKPVPKPRLIGPNADGYDERPTFTIDSTKKKLLVTWAESADELERRKQAKEVGVPYCCSPNPTSEAKIVIFVSDHISALEATPPFAITMYSFFPKLGTVFITTQGLDVFRKNSIQQSFFAACNFSWSNQH